MGYLDLLDLIASQAAQVVQKLLHTEGLQFDVATHPEFVLVAHAEPLPQFELVQFELLVQFEVLVQFELLVQFEVLVQFELVPAPHDDVLPTQAAAVDPKFIIPP